MLEAIVASCRAIASEPNLLILYHLSQEPELSAGVIAQRAAMLPSVASTHLGCLASRDLIRCRRSGARAYYRIASSAEGAQWPTPAPLMCRAFGDPDWATRGWDEGDTVHVQRLADAVAEGILVVCDVIFDAATAFANVRRLQIIRYVAKHGPCTNETLRNQLRMSSRACWRHIDKLARRGYVAAAAGGWQLVRRGRTPLHRELLASVMRGLR